MSTVNDPLPSAQVEALRRHPPFDVMEEAALTFIANRASVQRYAGGATILDVSQQKARLHIVVSGQVYCELADPDDLSEELYPTLGPGACFPIGALTTHTHASGAYRALEPTDCLELDTADFATLLRLSSAFQAYCFRVLAALLERSRTLLRDSEARASSEQQSMSSSLATLLRRPPVSCSPDTPIADVARIMAGERVGSMVIADKMGLPIGIFTQQDLLDRVVAPGTDIRAPVASVMSAQPVSLKGSDSAYDAALAMAQHRVRHLPVLDEHRFVGVVSERDLFSIQRTTLRQLPQAIASADDIGALVQVASDIRHLASDMLRHGVAAQQLTQFIAALNDRLTQRIIEMELIRFGLHDIRLAWIALGSEGRLEQTLATDQDNGIIFSQPQDMDAETARARLLPFATAINQALDRCGFPLCKGNIMAGNPQWCLSLAEWRARFAGWMRVPEPQAVLNCTIFFDFRAVFGDASLAEHLRTWLVEWVQGAPFFLYHLVQGALQTRPPLGWLRDFTYDRAEGFPHTIDLKLAGLRPFVEAARILALRHGIRHTNTAQRLRLIAPKINIGEGEIAAAVEAFYFIQLLRLRHQHSEAAKGAPNRIDPRALNPFDRGMLKASFREARKLQQYLELEFRM